jgi:hypothetical protein
MIVVTLFALVPCGYVGWQVKIVRERKSLAEPGVVAGGGYIEGNRSTFYGADVFNGGAGSVTPRGKSNIPLIRRMLGDHEYLHITLWRSASDQLMDQYRAAFPEATIERYEYDEHGN